MRIRYGRVTVTGSTHTTIHLQEFLVGEMREDVQALYLKQGHCLAVMVVLNDWVAVEHGQGRVGLGQEGTISATVIQVMAQTGNIQAHFL